MRILKRTAFFLIYSNLLISLAAVAFFFTGIHLLKASPPGIKSVALIFSATFITYNLTAFVSSINGQGSEAGGRVSWYRKHQMSTNFLLLGNLLVLLWSFPFHSPEQSFFFLHLGIISVLYNLPDRFPGSRFRSIRSIPLLKIFLIAYVWAAIGAWYPAFQDQSLLGSPHILFFLFFIFILSITLPFDIRDYHADKRSSLLTVPGVIGMRQTKWCASFLILVYCSGIGLLYSEWLAATALSGTTLPLIALSSESKPDWYYTGLIDSVLVVQYLLIIYL